MSKLVKFGAGGVRKVKEIYVGAGGIKKVKSGYIGASGVKQFFSSYTDLVLLDGSTTYNGANVYTNRIKYSRGTGGNGFFSGKSIVFHVYNTYTNDMIMTTNPSSPIRTNISPDGTIASTTHTWVAGNTYECSFDIIPGGSTTAYFIFYSYGCNFLEHIDYVAIRTY